MMMMARRGEGREIEEGKDGKEKRERKRRKQNGKGQVQRSADRLDPFPSMDILFSVAIYGKPQALVCIVRVVTPVTAVGPLQWSAPAYGESLGMSRGEC